MKSDLFRPGPSPAVRGTTLRAADAVCWHGGATLAAEVAEAVQR